MLVIVALLAAPFCVASAPAAAVTFTLDLNVPDAFTITASASLDNGGIARYSIPLTGTVLTLDHRSPNVFKLAPNGNSGFSNLRSADIVGATTNTTVEATRDFSSPHQVYGFGQTAGMFTGTFFPNDPTSDTAWNAELLLARGTYDSMAGTLGVNTGSATFLAGVYIAAGDNRTMAAIPELRIIPLIPEPATITLIGLAAMGLLGIVRRRSL